MALILNIETATTVCSVALAKDGELIALEEVNNGYTHAENLTVFIEKLVKESKIDFKDIDAIAISKGPGSYTGLRIGVSTAKGLCYGLGKPLIGLSTLKCLAFQKTSRKSEVGSRKDKKSPVPRLPAEAFQRRHGPSSLVSLLCPMLDARRMEVYCALYDDNLNEIEPIQAKIIDEHSFEEHLKNNTIYFFGDGAAKCREKLGTNANAVFIDNVFPSAAAMVSFSETAFNAEQFEDVAYFEPYYLKDFVAGPKRV